MGIFFPGPSVWRRRQPGDDDDVLVLPTILPNPQLDHTIHHKTPAHTKHPLSALLPLDLFAAVTSALLVSPLVLIIDRAIVINSVPHSNTTLSQAMWAGLVGLVRRPGQFVRDRGFGWVVGLYVGTYAVANGVEVVGHAGLYDPAMPKFVAASGVNVALNLLKDRHLATTCGPLPSHPVSLASFTLFGLRDTVTVFSSFILPPIIVPHLITHLRCTEREAAVMAQFMAPVAMQVVSTPAHLLGLDLYNRPLPSTTPHQRWQAVRANYLSTTVFRMARKIPAFGLGGACNGLIREEGRRWLA
ncbi:uncharacterized protein EV422DRAFT_569476 [Fimicolochytrium jonesii]|uniref:uncharacterized protein n=1 Tax=Fimicolochytrium jonesii TaxID=1396493 RepID=UPI0022FE6440|nr:uncharacterized protein EV422DRAFT_569476 [Fimicolochytrium jonesii]KAI8818820.1 hypothetical protein EV422DRAFT_569476 [Fimicolochytrium jonesii]